MRTFLTLRSRFWESSRRRGFSLIELVVTAAIIALISTIVIVRFAAFDSSVILKSLAFEIALSLREAQAYSVSVLGAGSSGNDFDTPYGISFTPDTKQYRLFQYTGTDTTPTYSESVDINVFTIGRTMFISDLCVVTSSNTHCSSGTSISRLDISFRRPEFNALFNGHDLPGGVTNSDIESAQIKITSTSGSDVWVVEVGLLGQISVEKE